MGLDVGSSCGVRTGFRPLFSIVVMRREVEYAFNKPKQSLSKSLKLTCSRSCRERVDYCPLPIAFPCESNGKNE